MDRAIFVNAQRGGCAFLKRAASYGLALSLDKMRFPKDLLKLLGGRKVAVKCNMCGSNVNKCKCEDTSDDDEDDE